MKKKLLIGVVVTVIIAGGVTLRIYCGDLETRSVAKALPSAEGVKVQKTDDKSGECNVAYKSRPLTRIYAYADPSIGGEALLLRYREVLEPEGWTFRVHNPSVTATGGWLPGGYGTDEYLKGEYLLAVKVERELMEYFGGYNVVLRVLRFDNTNYAEAR